MTNREKYAEEIKNYDGGDFCTDFVKKKILKKCARTCTQCKMIQTLWLDEECKEPEVDWSKVPVDTKILVKYSNDAKWIKRYFAKYENGIVYAFADGSTSWTSPNQNSSAWKYAKLAEVEE